MSQWACSHVHQEPNKMKKLAYSVYFHYNFTTKVFNIDLKIRNFTTEAESSCRAVSSTVTIKSVWNVNKFCK